MNRLKTFVLFFILVLLYSCRSTDIVSDRLQVTEDKELLLAVFNNNKKSDSFYYKMKMTAWLDGRKINAKSTLRIDKDKLMMISATVPFIGVEVARVEVDKDCILLVNKMDKVFVRIGFRELSRELGLDITFNDFQSMFLNDMFLLSSGSDLDKSRLLRSFYIASSPSAEKVFIVPRRKSDQYVFEADVANAAISKTSIFSPTGGTLECSYSDFDKKEQNRFPQTMELSLKTGSKAINVDMSVTSLSLNKSNLKRLDLKRYHEVSFDDFLGVIK